jgi:glutamate N-acetyltransferase/amino-acid N-acetyltransferase
VSVLGFAAGRVAAPQREALQVLLLTDARLAPPMLEKLLSDVAARSFGSIAGIAIPRPSDRMVALANGVAGESELEPDSIGGTTLRVGAVALAQGLVRQLLETSFAPRRARLVQITVSGARDDEQATRAAEALAADEPTRAAMASEGPRDESVAALANPLAGASGASGSVRSSWSARADQAALRVDLGAGAGLATRWTAVAAR